MKLSVNRLMAALVVELIEGDVPRPLTQEFPVYALWSDLARLAGEEPPAEIAALLDAPALDRPVGPGRPVAPVPALIPTTRRGSFLDWESQFHEEPA